MIYLNVDADQKPEKVMMENLPGGAMTVRMADNINKTESYKIPSNRLLI